ncbi:MAG: 2-C-methyl-D-erythritol 2,4-cyclodiphosphate synthase [Candidatus Marinimicrobia bacterium]|jgi:2-C-methyl-D-erythritol 2,4-cyclodiphosphate synthase|nr:2-C-methyl-D-erythritol 2,4-cyclodiphosphate synthase [Candidatus Neomarinimicrobiota bacterium]
MNLRIGQGYDVHRLTEGRPLILGGVTIPHSKGPAGHSDADVLTHAVMDALLGAAALGDIGTHFPDTDPAYHNANSLKLLEKVVSLLEQHGYAIVNVDATLILQRPKIAPFILEIRKNLSQVIHIPLETVSVKATTEEGLGFTGMEEGITAMAVCLIRGS